MISDHIYNILFHIIKYGWPAVFVIVLLCNKSTIKRPAYEIVEHKGVEITDGFGKAGMISFILIALNMAFCDFFFNPNVEVADALGTYLWYIRMESGTTLKALFSNHGFFKSMGYLIYCIFSGIAGPILIDALIGAIAKRIFKN